MGEPLDQQRGAVAVLFALLLVVLVGAVAFVIDIGRLIHARQVAQNAVDLGALAGGHDLPVQDGAGASEAMGIALRVALDNAPELSPSEVTVAFSCVVGDRDGDGVRDMVDVSLVCGPGPGAEWPPSTWTIRGKRAWHDCDPFAGDRCNTIILRTNLVIPYYFAPVLGFERGSTGPVHAAACRGPCGATSKPLDAVMVLDRTRSMTAFDLANAKNAALSVLEFYDPTQQHVGLVGLPYHDPSDPCRVLNPQTYPNPSPTVWRLVPMSDDYRSPDGRLRDTSLLVSTIRCLQRPPDRFAWSPSGAGHTDIGDPLQAAAALLAESRPDVPDAIILLSDGEANQPRYDQPCSYAAERARAAKVDGITIYTIAYGVADARCRQDTAGAYANAFASTFLAEIAGTATTPGGDDWPGGCASTENTDGDHYFCESAGADLEPVFRQVAAAAAGTSRLLDL